MAKKENTQTISERLLKSSAINSLSLETKVYDSFKRIGWTVPTFPYYNDPITNKFREADIIAREKYWKLGNDYKNELDFDLRFICECKSIKDYHIVVSNKLEDKLGCNLIQCWIGNESYFNYPRLDEVLKQRKITTQNIMRIKKELDSACYPNDMFKFNENSR